MTLSFEQIRAYFEHLLPGQRIGTRNKLSVKCPFHDDRTPSMTLFLDGAGGAHCNGCGAGGNIFQLEARRSGCTLAEAEAKVAEITGARASFGSYAKLGPVIAAYDYRDSDWVVLYQKRRYQPEGEPKTFRVYRPTDSGNWVSGIDAPDEPPTKRVLYNLPLLITANVAIVCEGEKDCENVAHCGLWTQRSTLRAATTCNFDGAWRTGEKAKWLPHYNPFFAGKLVIVFVDNDESGTVWSQTVAASIYPYAYQVKIVTLPGLPEKGDVSDWLLTHTTVELEEQIGRARAWRPLVEQRAFSMFQDAVEFAAEADKTVDWLVTGVIPRAGNGIIGGHPKASKSFTALDIAIAASCGAPWMGHAISTRVRTAVVSREDEPGLTQRRIKKLICGRPEYQQLEGWCLLNTRRHTADFKVTNDQQMDLLIEQLGRFNAQLVVLDVFRTIHDAEENDNTEVARVLAKVTRIQTELRCAVALVHHIAKVDEGDIFKGLRGASAIHGWMEWGIGISISNPESEDRAEYIRRAEFESKEGAASPVYFQISESADNSSVELRSVPRPDKKTTAKRSVASQNTTNALLLLPERERRDLM
ncbi:MAG TPA: AAA family ATPase [Pyrinomonadaceae bacterium]|jgi:hypothetical protein|nr:AAA family ATPase [Pyrinomonadaceae bacterium]